MDISRYISDESINKLSIAIDDEKINRFLISTQNCQKMDLKQKQTVIDEITVKQPHLIHEINNLKKLGVYEEHYQDLINHLIFLYGYFSDDGKTELPVVTEKIIKEIKTNLEAYITWQHYEDPEEKDKLLARMIVNHPEMFALGYVSNYINDCNFPSAMPGSAECFMFGRVVLDCFIRVKKESANC